MSKSFLDKNIPIFLNNRTSSIVKGSRQQKEVFYMIIKIFKTKNCNENIRKLLALLLLLIDQIKKGLIA